MHVNIKNSNFQNFSGLNCVTNKGLRAWTLELLAKGFRDIFKSNRVQGEWDFL